jgi:hypothetical protein
MSAAHTPTPWAVDDRGLIHEPFFGGDIFAQVYERNREANAAFIVRAVNAHDDLVAALEDARGRLQVYAGFKDSDRVIPSAVDNRLKDLASINAAIAKAQAQS